MNGRGPARTETETVLRQGIRVRFPGECGFPFRVENSVRPPRKGTFVISTGTPNHVAEDIYTALRASLRSSDPLANQVLDQVLAKQGKGVRPVFMALVAELIGGTWDSVRNGAVVVESVHLASLLHDDVLDHAALRRGMETVNARHSDKVSILIGDHIIVEAFQMAQVLAGGQVVPILLRGIRSMVRGEIRDVLDRDRFDEQQYLSVVRDKTAALFSGAAELSMLLAGGGERERALACELGENVGIAFQIIDDALDYGNTAGKPSNSDFQAGNITLPLIYALRDVSVEEKQRFVADASLTPERLNAFVAERGGIEYAFARAREYADQARSVVARFERPAVAEKFNGFFDMLLSRSA